MSAVELKAVKSDTRPAEKPDIAIGMVVEVAISEGQSLQFSTCAGRDDSAEQINGVLDKIMAAGERQKNKFALASCKRNLVIHEREIGVAHERMREAELRHAKETISRNAAKDELQNEINAIVAIDQARFEVAGRRGEYKASPEANKQMQPILSQIHRIEMDQQAQDQVKADAIKASEDAIRSYEANLKWTNSEIARYEAALAE